jgi:curved DNA-binding protein CbpA
MNTLDAAKLLGLSGTINPTEVKIAYRRACATFHPDRNPAGTEMMKAINEAYATLKGFDGELDTAGENYGEALFEALQGISGLTGLIIEVCGSWVWVTGDTKQHKNTLKEHDLKWASKKKAWYLRPDGDRRSYRGNCTLDEIRANHGSKTVTNLRQALSA